MTVPSEFDLQEKRILLVGATGVLGRAYAQAIAKTGAQLAIADLSSSDILTLAASIGAYGIEMDVTDEISVQNGIEAAIAELGGLDGAISNAAATSEFIMKEGDPFAAFEEYPLTSWQKTIDINLTGSFLVAREAGRAMKTSGGGSLVLVSSIYGVVGPDHSMYKDQSFKSLPGYSASKAGVIGLTRWLATWWGDAGIRVNCLTPGGTYNDHNASFTNAYGKRTPIGRMANREELTGMMMFLLSDASNYCTGQNYIVDGGYTAW